MSSDRAQPAALLTVTDARTSVAHLVTADAVTIGRRLGRYIACCGAEVLASSLTAEESGYCRGCRTATGGGCHG